MENDALSFKCSYCGKMGEHVCLPELAQAMEDKEILEGMWRVYLTMTEQYSRIGVTPIKLKQGARRVIPLLKEG